MTSASRCCGNASSEQLPQKLISCFSQMQRRYIMQSDLHYIYINTRLLLWPGGPSGGRCHSLDATRTQRCDWPMTPAYQGAHCASVLHQQFSASDAASVCRGLKHLTDYKPNPPPHSMNGLRLADSRDNVLMPSPTAPPAWTFIVKWHSE